MGVCAGGGGREGGRGREREREREVHAYLQLTLILHRSRHPSRNHKHMLQTQHHKTFGAIEFDRECTFGVLIMHRLTENDAPID